MRASMVCPKCGAAIDKQATFHTNSGGPPVNSDGHMIGNNTYRLLEIGGDSVENIGFAVSVIEINRRLFR